jgi:hypothetical protein
MPMNILLHSQRGVEPAPRRSPTFLSVASCSAYPYRTYSPGDCSLAYSLYHHEAIPPNVDEDFMGERAGDGKICFDNIKVFRYASCIASSREPPARGGASREKTPFLSPCGFESLVVRVGPVSMDSASGTYIIKEVTGDSQEYKINPTCVATFVVP